jgi:DNA-binding transcriptional MerR regulator
VVPAQLLKIGAVASRSGLSVKTIRFYCDEGLIQPSGRSEGGYRLFDEGVFAELALIRTLRAMELPLADVRQTLEARRSGVCTCSDLKARIRGKAGEIGEKIRAMQNLRGPLAGSSPRGGGDGRGGALRRVQGQLRALLLESASKHWSCSAVAAPRWPINTRSGPPARAGGADWSGSKLQRVPTN